jgi:hypothetical protein
VKKTVSSKNIQTNQLVDKPSLIDDFAAAGKSAKFA